MTRHRAVDERAVDDDVDVVEAVAQDRDAGGERERARSRGRAPRSGPADGPSARRTRSHMSSAADGRGERADGEHELELLTLDAARSPQADDQRRRARAPIPAITSSQPAKSTAVHRGRASRGRTGSTPPRTARRSGPGRSVPASTSSAIPTSRHASAGRQRRDGQPPVREKEQRETEQSRGRLADHGVEHGRRRRAGEAVASRADRRRRTARSAAGRCWPGR